MPTTARDEIRSALEDAVLQIAHVPLSSPEVGADAFNDFRRAVQHASSGKESHPGELLGDLEPKTAVLNFLCVLHEKKRVYRKHIVAVAAVLLQDPTWLAALKGDAALCSSLPHELQALLGEDGIGLQTSKAPPLLQDVPDTPQHVAHDVAQDAVQAIAKTAEGNVVEADKMQAPPPSTAHLEMLMKAQSKMEALDYSADVGDDAIDAFEQFRKAVVQVASSKSEEERGALGQLEPKDRLLQFLVDFYARQRKYRLRITSILVPLLYFEEWLEAAKQDSLVYASIRELVPDSMNEPKIPIITRSAGVAINLQTAAKTAAARGSAGALYVSGHGGLQPSRYGFKRHV